MTAKTSMILVSAALLLGAGPATVAEDGAQMRVSADGMLELAMEKRFNPIATSPTTATTPIWRTKPEGRTIVFLIGSGR